MKRTKSSERENKPGPNKHYALHKATARSRVTNGRDLLPDVDHRSQWVRRFRDILSLHINSDLVGPDNCSEAEKAIARRAACLIVELEQLEAKFAQAGESTPLQFKNYQRGCNTLRRLLESLASGFARRAKEVNVTYDQFSEDVERLRETGFIDALNDDRDGAAP